MLFTEFSDYLRKLETTSSRLSITEILAQLFNQLSADEIDQSVNLLLGQLRPKFNRLEFNLAEKMVMRAIAEANNKPLDAIKALYKQIGDLGEVVERLKKEVEEINSSIDIQQDMFSQPVEKGESKTVSLTIVKTYQKLVEIAQTSGVGSQESKKKLLVELLNILDTNSSKYLVRIILGKLRLGFSDMTVLDALSWMVTGDKQHRKTLELAYQISPDIGKIAHFVKIYGIEDVTEKISVELGVPVVPALAQRLKTADEMIEKMGEVGVEPKFDGTRVQIHFKRGEFTRSFTRNLDETTHMFPELQNLSEASDADELILDSEAVGYDPKTGVMRPFQETIQRKRKHGVEAAALEIPLKFFVFDVIYKNGESLIHFPFHQRRKILEQTIKNHDVYEVSQLIKTHDPEELRQFHAEQLAQGLEGALVKKWDGVYEPGRRGWSWVKFKESETSKAKLSDTIDAVVMGLYRGRGKRTEFGVGAFLVGVKGDSNGGEDNFYTISKVGTGLSDSQWRELKQRSIALETDVQPNQYQVPKELVPDIWLTPDLVVEIAADEITKSPLHSADIALRFPRLVRFRDDKSAAQVTTLCEVKSIM